MIFHHILLDLVSDFLKGSKRGLKKLFLNLFYAIKIFAGLSKHLYVFILGTENVVVGAVEIVVVVCG